MLSIAFLTQGASASQPTRRFELSITHFYTQSDTEAMAAMANMLAISEGDPFWAFTQSNSQFAPMYRLVHPGAGHLFTTFMDERDAAVNEDGYIGEGIGYWCVPANLTTLLQTQPLFRLYNAALDDHFYTLDPNEISAGYTREGIACLVLSQQTDGSVPLFRLRSPLGLHFYSVDTVERQTLLNEGYVDEGTTGFVLASMGGVPKPLFRSYHPKTGGHLYTADITEHDAATKSYGYRGDGISCFLWPDGMQPSSGVISLLRAYNSVIDDHFYTTDAAEHANAVQNLGYADEGIAGWVLSNDVGRFTELAAPVHRLSGDFANNFLLLPPGLPSFLSSNSNFFITSAIGATVNPIVGLDVELSITSDITAESVNFGDLGMGFQLNGYSPQFYTSSWQQFGIFFEGGELTCEIQNWAKSPYEVGFVVGSATLCHIKGNTLKAGHRLRVVLEEDEFANILGADFYAYDGKNQLGHKKLLVKNFKYGTAFGAAPIVGFQYVLVGPYDAEKVTLAPGGAGILTYQSAVALAASSQLPPNTEWPDVGTGEESNAIYGEITATKSKILNQTLSVGSMVQPLSLRSPEKRLKRFHKPERGN